MKPSEVDALVPGAELDALVADKVMGWERRNYGLFWDPVAKCARYPQGLQDVRKKMGLEGEEDCLFTPSTNIKEAWEVLKKMRTFRKEPGMFSTPTPIFTLFIMAIDQMARAPEAHATTVYNVLATFDPAMICRAALKAVIWAGQEEKEVKVKA